MKIVAVQFDYVDRKNMYAVLLSAFENSCKHHMPDAELKILRLQAPNLNHRRKKTFSSNTLKLKAWVKELKASTDDVILMDCDMLVLGDMSGGFAQEFDIAYTVRSHSTIPINGGVIFVRPNERSIKFFEEMIRINDRMYGDSVFHQQYRGKYHGLNQAAFGYMLEEYKGDIKLLELPTRIYNSCDDTWGSALSDAKAVHIKGPLRRECLGWKSVRPQRRELVEEWVKWVDKEIKPHIQRPSKRRRAVFAKSPKGRKRATSVTADYHKSLKQARAE